MKSPTANPLPAMGREEGQTSMMLPRITLGVAAAVIAAMLPDTLLHVAEEKLAAELKNH